MTPLLHWLFIDQDIFSIFNNMEKNQDKIKLSFEYF